MQTPMRNTHVDKRATQRWVQAMRTRMWLSRPAAGSSSELVRLRNCLWNTQRTRVTNYYQVFIGQRSALHYKV